MKKILTVIFLLLTASQLISQTLYIPMDTANLEVRKKESERYLEDNKKFLESIHSNYKGGERTFIKKHFENLQKEFNEELLAGNYLFDDRFSGVINKVVDEIKSKNSQVPGQIKFFVSKRQTLNAASMGDNNFFVNMGSFCYLDNEAQLAAIISHEIAHLMLQHQVDMVRKHYATDKYDAKKQVRDVKNEKNNKSERAWDKIKEIIYAYGKYNRKSEFEADSLGFLLFKNTSYNPADYLSTLKLTDRYDSIKPQGLALETYKKVFNLPSQSFKEEWLKNEDFQNYNYSYKEKIDADSVKSHPEITERIANLQRIFPELKEEKVATKPTEAFSELQKIAIAERPSCLSTLEEYGVGIYLCLLHLQADENDAYYKKWLGDFFNKTYDARKAYTLNRYLDRVNPKEQSESYQQFLNFMWNLRLTEIKNIADYYTKKGS